MEPVSNQGNTQSSKRMIRNTWIKNQTLTNDRASAGWETRSVETARALAFALLLALALPVLGLALVPLLVMSTILLLVAKLAAKVASSFKARLHIGVMHPL